ncbi:hypothetical protein [Photobacterium damselae]|nr:hypothetical protein [Photobacterium damselae]
MIKIINKVFGELTFSSVWKKSYDIIEENDDKKEIREEQKDSYVYYSK